MPVPVPPSVLLITGASSGLGAALARAYARPGITLALLGRNGERLKNTVTECNRRGAAVETGLIDVRDAPAMRDWLETFDERHPIDLVIANAGLSAGTGLMTESPEQARVIFGVNLDGVLATVLPLIPRMQARRRGQIALISSLAGLRGLPSCPAYSASKMAVRALGEAWRGALRKDGIRVSVVCPGYIETPMTAVNSFPMPFLMSADKAAGIIRRGLERNRARIAFPRLLYLPLWWLCCLPVALTDPLFASLPRKTAMEVA